MSTITRAACRALLLFLPFSGSVTRAETPKPEMPKLVVAILIDQFRYDYLDRLSSHFGEGGFKLLTEHGAVMTFARYDYFPTITGPGHASFLSGSPPAVHGIIGNDWYDKKSNKMINCVSDESVNPVGTTNAGSKRSPKNFVGDNFSDQMRLRYQSKVVGVSWKDRAAILPSGKKPTGAYWVDGQTGNFVTSTYYMKDLPAWVKAFNARKLTQGYEGQTWDRLLPVDAYTGVDNAPGEGNLAGEKQPVFPHKIYVLGKQVVEPISTPKAAEALDKETGILKTPAEATDKTGPAKTTDPKGTAPATSSIEKVEKPAAATPAAPPKPNYDNIETTPFGNELVAEFAKAAVEGEQLGTGPGPDVLTVSFSSLDGAGHIFGPFSQEAQDTVYRLDRDLTGLFAYLDKKIGLANICIVFTADHGAAPTAEWAAQQGFASERVDEVPLMADLLGKLSAKFGPGNYLQTKRLLLGNLYFNHEFLAEKKIPEADLAAFIREWAFSTGKFEAAFSRDQLLGNRAAGLIGLRAINGFNGERSGDMVLVYKPYMYSWGKTGTTHGSPYSYDTHVPVIFYGAPFRPGRYADAFNITDLAPTLCAALRVETPAGAIGTPCAKILSNP